MICPRGPIIADTPVLAARTMGIAEILLGAAAVVTGAAALWGMVAIAYAAFTVFVFWALQSESGVGSCGCFGREDTPPTPGHAAYNAAASALALLGAFDPVRVGDFEGSAFEAGLLIVSIAMGIVLSVLALTSLPRLLAVANGSAPAPVAQFNVGANRGGQHPGGQR